MATLQELLTSEELKRFKDLYSRGQIDRHTVGLFAERFKREIDFIDHQRTDVEQGKKRMYSPSAGEFT